MVILIDKLDNLSIIYPVTISMVSTTIASGCNRKLLRELTAIIFYGMSGRPGK